MSLEAIIKHTIRERGAMTIAEYMSLCLSHPVYGYYIKQDPFGVSGDFMTAPEISQTFGELVGLWCADVWSQMGEGAVALVELGAGRGTLMADALRATRRVPGFLEAAAVSLIEVGAPLIADQKETLAAWAEMIAWRTRLADVPPAPTIVIGNEILDVCPVQQLEIAGGEALPRGVGLAGDRLDYTRLPSAGQTGVGSRLPAHATLRDGDICEVQDWPALDVWPRDRSLPWSALFIDYGHFDPSRADGEVVAGDTLQAVRNHSYEHPLTSPGEADLTCHVDFDGLRSHIRAEAPAGRSLLAVDGPVTQGEFLGRLGIMERASRLMSANPDKAHAIEAGVARLMAVPGMGDRFKAIGIRTVDLPPLPGF
ncbi:MAG: SAM-dependent methyltransferase [Hyphomicrobiaceae bacterium]|nr:SAM-dependent methyltransferase [Hyphomicrobiaceae bacterium]